VGIRRNKVNGLRVIKKDRRRWSGSPSFCSSSMRTRAREIAFYWPRTSRVIALKGEGARGAAGTAGPGSPRGAGTERRNKIATKSELIIWQ
jgi:hypothetical protein